MTIHTIRYLLSDIFLVIFMLLLVIGLIGMFRFKSSYGKLLNSSKIDSVASLLLFLGLMLRANSFSILSKLFIVTLFYMLTSPVSNQLIVFAIKKQETDLDLAKEEGYR